MFINNLGFGDVWVNFNSNVNYSFNFKQRICDQYLKTWNTSVQSMSKLDFFKRFKTKFKHENYLDYISNDKIRTNFTRFRLSAHSLEIEAGRYLNIKRENRFCKMCNVRAVESEYHFLLCCPKYRRIRCKYIKNSAFPNVSKFVNIVASSNKRTINIKCSEIHN